MGIKRIKLSCVPNDGGVWLKFTDSSVNIIEYICSVSKIYFSLEVVKLEMQFFWFYTPSV